MAMKKDNGEAFLMFNVIAFFKNMVIVKDDGNVFNVSQPFYLKNIAMKKDDGKVF